MPLTVDITATEYAGAQKFRHAEVTVDYEAGGVTFLPNSLNMNRFQNVILTLIDGDDPAQVVYNESADTIELYSLSDGTEIAGGTQVDLRVTGIGR